MRLLIVSGALSLAIAGAAMADSKSYDFTEFHSVVAGSGLDVTIAEGSGFAVTAEGSGRGLDRLDIRQSGDTLRLSLDRRGLERFSPILWVLEDEVSVSITLPRLEAVAATSGSDVRVSGATAESFTGESNSGATLAITGIDAARVHLEATSGADLTASGRCGALEAIATSGADLDAEPMACETADLRASSGSDLDAQARKVRADASSGSRIDVWAAETVESNESSGGDVTRH